MLILGELLLREFWASDIAPLAAGRNSRRLAALAQPMLPRPVTEPVLRARFEQGVAAVSSGGAADVEFVVARRRDRRSRPLGVAGLYGVDHEHGTAEIGVDITAKKGRGGGLGLDAFVLLADYALHDLRLHRVSAHVKASNVRARGALARIGLTEEGVLRDARWIDGRFESLHVFAMLAPEWDPALRSWRDRARPVA